MAARLGVSPDFMAQQVDIWRLPASPRPPGVLRSGGHTLVTTVDQARDKPSDASDVATRRAAEHGLIPAGETSFVGVGQRGEPGYILVSFVRT